MNWQPISTAPKNKAGEFYGPTILILLVNDGLPWPAYWGPAVKTDGGNAGAWFICDDKDDNEVAPQYVSHWMPLPPRPDTARMAALDELARRGQDFDTDAGASVIQGLCEAIVSQRDTSEAAQ